MKAPPAVHPPGLTRLVTDLMDVRAVRGAKLPPGELGFSLIRTHRFQRDPLRMLLSYYARFGPVFTVRIFHRPTVAMLGPEANHFVTVGGAENFGWRQGMFGEHLTPLIGDGLITTDDEYHDRARRILMPAFHRRQMDAAVAVMTGETERVLEEFRRGDVVDVYETARDLTMSIAMRALVGLDPRDHGIGHNAAVLFERGLSFYETETWMMMLRGPGSPWAHMQAARRGLDAIIFAEIDVRRSSRTVAGNPGHASGNGSAAGEDVLSMLLDARDEDGDGFTDAEIRDQLMHLLFGGHDTSSSTISFLMYQLARHPDVLAHVVEEQDRVLGGRRATVEELLHGLPYLDMVLDETLRLHPPVWFGPRKAVNTFDFQGHRIPLGTHVIHSSWASHRLPDVFPDPDRFDPERFSPENRRELPRGAYIPFGGGQRVCIGKRFGQLVVKAVATTLLQRHRFVLAPGYRLEVATAPTLTPKGGLPMVVAERGEPGLAARARVRAGTG
jgi:cytochrome P450